MGLYPQSRGTTMHLRRAERGPFTNTGTVGRAAFANFRYENGPSQGRNLALTGVCVPLRSTADYRGTSLTRKRTPLGPYSRPVHRAL